MVLEHGELLHDDAGVGVSHADAHILHVFDLLAYILLADGGVGDHKLETIVDEPAVHINEKLPFRQICIEREQQHADLCSVGRGDAIGKINIKYQAGGILQLCEHERAGNISICHRQVGQTDFFFFSPHGDPLVGFAVADEMLAYLCQKVWLC